MSTSWRATAGAALIAAVTCLGFAPSLLAQTSNPPNATIGRWKLNVEKTPGTVPGTVSIRTFEDMGGGLILATVETAVPGATPVYRQYAVKHDGKFYPGQARGRTTFNTIAYMPTDNPRFYEWAIKVDGVLGNTGTTTVSADGKIMTITGSAPDAVPGIWDRLP